MKRALVLLATLIAGSGAGAGAAYGVNTFLAAPAHQATDADTSFVPSGPVLAPLVFPDGRLAGYVSFELQLQVPEGEASRVEQRMPMLLHAINLRTFRTPMTSGPDGQLPNLSTFRRIVMDAAPQAFGPNVVRRVAITQARPA